MTMKGDVLAEPLINEHDAAVILGIPVSTLRTMRVRPEYQGPPFIKVGRQVRYSKHALRDYVRQRTIDPATAISKEAMEIIRRHAG